MQPSKSAFSPTLQLTWELAKRDLTDRYAGNGLGLVWLIIQPVAMVAIYLSVFTYIFQIRIPESVNVNGSFSLFFLSGFVCWMALSDSLSRAPTLVSGHASLVKQIVFPTEILPIKSALAVSMTQVIFLVVVLIFSIRANGFDKFHLLLFVAVPMLLLFNAGMTSLLSAIGVFVKDIKDFVGLILAGGIFLTPVFYPPDSLSGGMKIIVSNNPLSFPIYCFQDILFYQRFEHPKAWIVFILLSLGLAVFGQYLFRSLKHLFGDAL